MKLKFRLATLIDIPEIICLRNAAADALTRKFGKGHWSSHSSVGGVRMGISNTSHLVLAFYRGKLAGTMRLAQKKPWAIDIKYFKSCKRPLYLTGMAVQPELQKKGIGKLMMEEAIKQTCTWPADALRLDAYDAVAGAGNFYLKCGFTEVARVIYKGVPLIDFELRVDQNQTLKSNTQ